MVLLSSGSKELLGISTKVKTAGHPQTLILDRETQLQLVE